MDDKPLEKMLHEMKDDYNKLPEYTNTKTVMHSIFARKRSKWGRLLPTVAIIAGMLLFMVVALPFINDEHQGDREAEYLKLYFQQKKETFRKELGIESVESFREVKQAERLVKQFELTSQAESFEQIKSEIDYLFTTPEQAIEQLNEAGESIGQNLEFGNKMLEMEASLQAYIQELFEKYAFTNDEQKALLEVQHDKLNYSGPSDIKAFLKLLDEQGFVLKPEEFESPAIKVQMDYFWIIGNNERLQKMEWFERYLELVETKIDLYAPGIYNEQQIPWHEFDTILLEIEDLFNDYPEAQNVLFEETFLRNVVHWYLEGYIEAGEYSYPATLNQDARDELLHFVNEHRDSKYWEIVNGAVKLYEANDWEKGDRLWILTNKLFLIFDEKFEELQLKDIHEVNGWPILSSTPKTYMEYVEEQDISLLEKLSSMEIISLYYYAVERKAEEVVNDIVINLDFNLSKVNSNELSYIIRTDHATNQETYQLLGGDNHKILEEVRLSKEGNMWKISSVELYQ
ncbi:hypothetical protein [Oceanobacillus profundus]|uniref:Uncharacterized protein n=1 Tax=Oceanobacillus profundus TaxID=372463 RepID=A0A417YMP3_9BACI|nr:hypothetical protein [Oceanobacillus profundus]RHW34573.1 hypothetical protein D1B32_05285 [Oceanobacillus profundus]